MMKKLLTILVVLSGLAASLQANAGMINVQVSPNNIGVGDSVEVSLLATGFAPFDVFDMDLEFDTSLLSYNPASLMSDLPLFDVMTLTFGLEVNEVATGVALSFVDLLPFAGGDFLLAKFELNGLADGVAMLGLADMAFSLSDPMDPFAPATELGVDGSDVDGVIINTVPEPGILALVLLAGLGMMRVRREI